ncbi:hypothetical protein Tco_0669801 [Tanacetum coccineum]
MIKFHIQYIFQFVVPTRIHGLYDEKILEKVVSSCIRQINSLRSYAEQKEAEAAISALHGEYTFRGVPLLKCFENLKTYSEEVNEDIEQERMRSSMKRVMGLETANSLSRIMSLLSAEREKREHVDLPITKFESGKLSVEDLSTRIMSSLVGKKPLLKKAGTKRKLEQEKAEENVESDEELQM